MAKFRKKPLVIEAVQISSKPKINFEERPLWLIEALRTGVITQSLDPGGRTWNIKSKEGIVRGAPGDWIVKGIKGELYVHAGSHFFESYDTFVEEKLAPATDKQVEVYSRPECIFHYCPSPDVCKESGNCQSPQTTR